MIAHPFAVPGAIIARERGLVKSVVAAYLAPSNLRSCHDPLTIGDTSVPRWVPMRWRRALWRFVEKGWIDPVAVAQLNAVRTPLGLPEVGSFLTHIMEAPDLSVTLFPSWFAPVVPDRPRPLIEGDFQLFEAAAQDGFTEALSAFLAAGEKPLVFTPGTGNRQAGRYFEAAAQAVAQLGLRAIFLTPHREQLPGSLPPSICWQDYVPLKALLPHVVALVHHGGIGTTAEALRAGTPQLVVPLAHDQFDNAARVIALGAGASLHARRVTPARMATALQHVLTGAVASQAAAVAARFTTPDRLDALCRQLEDLAHG